MESTEFSTGSHGSEPVRTDANPLEYDWLTVEEAVALCANMGLSRTPKTLRKWAERSFNKPDAEIVVRREDTMWSYRWKFEKASLLRKIEQEVELSSANKSEPVRTGVHDSAAGSISETAVNLSEPVRTGTEAFSQNEDVSSDEQGAHATEPVRTSSHATGDTSSMLEEVRDRLRDKDKEIEFLRAQLVEAQAEVGRSATSTDEALKTIDRVVRSFELQSEANQALALGEVSSTIVPEEATEPIRFAPEWPQSGFGSGAWRKTSRLTRTIKARTLTRPRFR